MGDPSNADDTRLRFLLAWMLSGIAFFGLTDLLLRGYGHKKIAELLQKSERTVRQQAIAVYRKSGLHGRAELSAFFLEGLRAMKPIVYLKKFHSCRATTGVAGTEAIESGTSGM